MSTPKLIVCPNCKAKLKFDPDKITSEVARFKCPGCKTVLRIRQSLREPEATAGQEAAGVQAVGGQHWEGAGEELKHLARRFEKEMGFHKTGKKEGTEEAAPPKTDADKTTVAAPAAPEETADKTTKTRHERKYKRVKFKKKVLVNNQIMVEALDISENGLFLHTGRSFEDGTLVEVGISTTPGKFDLQVKAEVRHNHRGIGMGLQFVDVDEEQSAQLKKLIGELDEAAARELEGRKKILLVGGTDTARNINKSKLMLDGFYVMQATTAEEVFQILRDEPPDAMVLEWQETKFNCKGLLARINEDPQYDSIIRIVLSALTDSAIQKEILDTGAHRSMAKMDTNPAKLSQALRQLIDERDGKE